MGYWERRQAQTMYEYMEDAEEVSRKLSRIYKRSSNELNAKIEHVYDTFKTRYDLSDDEARKLLSSVKSPSQIQALKEKAKTLESNALSMELESGAYQARIEHLEKLNKEIDKMSASLYKRENDISTSHYKDLAEDSYYHEIYNIQKQAGFRFDFDTLDSKAVDKVLRSKWSGANYSTRIWQNTKSLAADLQEELSVSLLTGKPLEELSNAVAMKYATSAFMARRLVRTESNYVNACMQMEAYKECDADKYEFVAVLDMRTSKKCQELDGKVFKVKDMQVGVNCNPMHPFCRSTTIIHLDDEVTEGLKRRARNPETGKNELVPADMSYKDWKSAVVDGNTSHLKQLSNRDIMKLNNLQPSDRIMSRVDALQNQRKVLYNAVKKESIRPEKEIIELLSGGDTTKGSCASLSFAYAGRKNGLEILDFRGGESLEYFSQNGNIRYVMSLIGDAQQFTATTEVKAAYNALQSMEQGKEYLLSAGKHASIVKKDSNGIFNYLELQSPDASGWTAFKKSTLHDRFGCKKTQKTVAGYKFDASADIVDITTIDEIDDYQYLMGFINTSSSEQLKGHRGTIR